MNRIHNILFLLFPEYFEMYASKKRTRQQSMRKVNFNTRKHGLLKKFMELKTLCDLTSCCLIMYDPKENQLKAYPEDVTDCHRIVKRYQETRREDRLKHIDSVVGLLNEKKNKCEAELAKLRSDNGGDIQYPAWDSSLDNMGLDELKDVAFKLDSLLECVKIKDEEANLQVQILQGTGPQPSHHACPSSYQSEWMDVDFGYFTGRSTVMAPPSNQGYVPHDQQIHSNPSSDCFTGDFAIASPPDQQIGWVSSNSVPPSADSNTSTVMTDPLDIQDYLPLIHEFEWNSDSTVDGWLWLDYDLEPSDNNDRLLHDAPAKKMLSGSGNQNDDGHLEVETSDMSCDMVAGLSDQQLFDIWGGLSRI